VNEEAAGMATSARAAGCLTWTGFAGGWFRMVRRVVFGDGAAEDHELSRMTAALRPRANWAFLGPQRTGLRDRLLGRISAYLERAETDSLAAAMATALSAPAQQVPQWLFAFDPAGMATFRAMALLASHPDDARHVRAEMAGASRAEMPFTRAVMLDSLRLWPTTPLILRETTEETHWRSGCLPASTGVIIFAPFFHRDTERLPYADRFVPELWMDDAARGDWPLVPFSEGPAECPDGIWCRCSDRR